MQGIGRFKNLIVAVIIVIIFILIINHIYTSKTKEIAQLEEKKEELIRGEETIKEWEEKKAEFDNMSKKFLQKDTLLFKKVIEEKANRSGINIGSLSTSRVDKGFYWETNIRIDATCTYKNFLDFIRSLDEKHIEIDRIRMATSGSNIRLDGNLRGIVIK